MGSQRRIIVVMPINPVSPAGLEQKGAIRKQCSAPRLHKVLRLIQRYDGGCNENVGFRARIRTSGIGAGRLPTATMRLLLAAGLFWTLPEFGRESPKPFNNPLRRFVPSVVAGKEDPQLFDSADDVVEAARARLFNDRLAAGAQVLPPGAGNRVVKIAA